MTTRSSRCSACGRLEIWGAARTRKPRPAVINSLFTAETARSQRTSLNSQISFKDLLGVLCVSAVKRSVEVVLLPFPHVGDRLADVVPAVHVFLLGQVAEHLDTKAAF